MAAIAELLGDGIYDKSANKVDAGSQLAGKVVGLYFSAHWCPPCRGFTPQLVDFYNKYREEKNFEIIFVSLDNDDRQFQEYYDQMPWLYFDFDESDKKDELSEKYNVQTIPKLILLDGNTGEVIQDDARNILLTDLNAERFPWKK